MFSNGLMWLAFPVTLGLSNADFAPFLKIMVTTKGVACCRSVLHRVLQGAVTLLVLFRSSCCGTGRVHPPYACPAVCTRPICQMTFTKPHLKDPSKLCSKGPFRLRKFLRKSRRSALPSLSLRSARARLVPPRHRAASGRAWVSTSLAALPPSRGHQALFFAACGATHPAKPHFATWVLLPKLYLHMKTPILP